MSDERKVRRKKLLIRYLILAACILVVAAITVTTVFAVNDWFRHDVSIDAGNKGDGNDDGNTPSDGENNGDDNKGDNNGDDENDKPTSSDTTFAQPVGSMDVSNPFDFGKDVSLGHWHFHEGVDISAAVGTDVVACLDGTVESVTLEDKLDGNTITISHANGIKTVYRFVNVKDGLKAGDSVKKGDKIGTVSEPTGSEFKQESHLHFEVIKNGERTDPADYLNFSEK